MLGVDLLTSDAGLLHKAINSGPPVQPFNGTWDRERYSGSNFVIKYGVGIGIFDSGHTIQIFVLGAYAGNEGKVRSWIEVFSILYLTCEIHNTALSPHHSAGVMAPSDCMAIKEQRH